MQFVQDNVAYVEQVLERVNEVIRCYESQLTDDDPIAWKQRRLTIDEMIRDCGCNHVRLQIEEAVAECHLGIQRVVSIVKAMKMFSHPGNEGRVLIDLNEAIDMAITISRTRWKYAAKVKLDLDRELQPVSVFASELNQVLLNLVVNACDAIVSKFGEGDQGQIHITTRSTETEVVIEIRDNGCGIPTEAQHRVFDQFFTTKEVGKGTGQGLALCRNVIVKMHGGTLRFESEVGQGTTFYIGLPKAVEQTGSEQVSEVDANSTVVGEVVGESEATYSLVES
ncbi:Blue-light-activated protein [Aeoliella mucimassa]|uniref:histidine kinase n=2 Tax=Aeoliella mucimassa TaxID=2527972 RepID=A0A518AN22_9BACT|nr:Blue-light-activated protein [Aeoliella mucimassa]